VQFSRRDLLQVSSSSLDLMGFTEILSSLVVGTGTCTWNR